MPEIPDTRPDSFIDWATSPPTPEDVVEPSPAKRANGWDGMEIPPHEWENWLKQRLDEWEQYIDEGRPRQFSTLEEAIANTTERRPALVNEHSDELVVDVKDLLEDIWTDDSGFDGTAVYTSGEYVYSGNSDGDLIKRNRSTGAVIWSVDDDGGGPPVPFGVIYDITGNGRWIYISAGVRIHRIDPADGSVLATKVLDNPASCLYATGEEVYVAGTDIDIADGNSDILWLDDSTLTKLGPGFDVTAPVFDVVADGEFVWIAHNRTAGNAICSIMSKDLSYIAGVQHGDIDGRSVALGVGKLFLGTTTNLGAGATNHAWALPKRWNTSTTIGSLSLWSGVPVSQQIGGLPPVARARALVYTGQYVAIGTNDNSPKVGSLQLLDPGTGGLVHWLDLTGVAHGVNCVDSDYFGLFISTDRVAPDNLSIRRVNLNPPINLIRRARLLGDDRSRQPWHKKHTVEGVF